MRIEIRAENQSEPAVPFNRLLIDAAFKRPAQPNPSKIKCDPFFCSHQPDFMTWKHSYFSISIKMIELDSVVPATATHRMPLVQFQFQCGMIRLSIAQLQSGACFQLIQPLNISSYDRILRFPENARLRSIPPREVGGVENKERRFQGRLFQVTKAGVVPNHPRVPSSDARIRKRSATGRERTFLQRADSN